MAPRPKSYQWRAAALTACAIVLGLACGAGTRTARPALGAEDADEADGILGRGSRDPSAVFGGARYGASYGASYGGSGLAGLGGKRYGNAAGGTLYGNYKIDTAAFEPRTSPPRPSSAYVGRAVDKAGTIEGTVTWKRRPRMSRTLATASGACGGSVANRSLVVDRRGRVQAAIVYLEEIHVGRQLLKGMSAGHGRLPNKIQLGGTVIVRGCQLWPRLQIVAPIGGALSVSRRGLGMRGVTVHPRQSKRPARTLDLSGEGMSQTIHLSGYGPYELIPSPALPTRAWAFVPNNPYAVVTGDDGRFRLGRVPPGNYKLVVWHPPIITGVDADGAPIQRPAVKRIRSVTVTANKTTQLRVSLN